MKIIFLDIDGVIATEESSTMKWHDEYSYPFDTTCVSILNKILKKTSAEIVLTSDWRIAFNYDLEALNRLFIHNKIIKSPIGVTSDLSSRNKEISEYIYKYSNKISSFLILDDMDLKIHPLRFIRTNLNEGLKQKGIEEKAIEILNSKMESLLNN